MPLVQHLSVSSEVPTLAAASAGFRDASFPWCSCCLPQRSVHSSGNSCFCSFWFYRLTSVPALLPPLAALGDLTPLQALTAGCISSRTLPPAPPPAARLPPSSPLEGPDIIQTKHAQNFTACTCLCPCPRLCLREWPCHSLCSPNLNLGITLPCSFS